MTVYWLCTCGNANKYVNTQELVLTSDSKDMFLGLDHCNKCGKEEKFDISLKIGG